MGYFFLQISGCTVRAFDPTANVIRPKNSYYPNLHYYNVGLNGENGKSYYGLYHVLVIIENSFWAD